MFDNKILCPFCFEEVELKNLWYRCSSSSCLEQGTTKIHIIKNNKPDRKGYCQCDICKKTTSIKVCPKCENNLPHNILDCETEIISIVGAKGSGKSYFVATVLRQIAEKNLMSRIGDISTRWSVKESGEQYKIRFKSKMDSFLPLDGTQLVNDLIKDNPPLLMEMTFLKKSGFSKKTVTKTFSFFDAAGESFEDSSVLASITPYLGHSRAVILILDPRQMKDVDDAISGYFPKLPPVSDISYSEILNNTADVIRDGKRLKTGKKIDIPLCIAFSKWDLLMKTPGLLPDGLVISQQNQQNVMAYDDNLVNQASLEIKSMLLEWAPDLVKAAEQRFEKVQYFGFSAWGLGATNGVDIPPIASYRVEDPLLWILRQDGVI